MNRRILELMELLYEVADGSGSPPAALAQKFLRLLHRKFALIDSDPDLPQVDQLETPLQHVAGIAGTLSGGTCGHDDYVRAVAWGIDQIQRECQSVDQDLLLLLLSCTRPQRPQQLVQAYKQQAVRGIQRLLTRDRLCSLVKRGLLDGDGDNAAGDALLDWVARCFPRSKGLDTLPATLRSIRSAFLYEIDQDWTNDSLQRTPALWRGRGCLPCWKALTGGLLRLRESTSEIDPLLLRLIIHWRPWRTSAQVVTAYRSLESLSDFPFSPFLENRLYEALRTADVVQLRMPPELVEVAVVFAARAVTTFLCHKEAVDVPATDSLRRWIDAAVDMVFNPPLLAIARAQESLRPKGRKGRPPTLKLLPLLGSRSDAARTEKHLLLHNMPGLTAALGQLPDRWDDETVYGATRLLVQQVVYESSDYARGENAALDPVQARRLRDTLTLLDRIRRKLPPCPRRTAVDAGLKKEIEKLEKRLQSPPGEV